ncbi:hypothetical protein [Halobaculum roseum]|uniref:Uncharacterized protein n=1 Tax=Halobaculum roseum TaxID=2175149 RepID=A0ABD5MU99_9EURY|nr:hypothetical protein [Halobaculum roseum]QZY01939.1 hypothetical protein K6T36_11540 [Halobaculum roseum]
MKRRTLLGSTIPLLLAGCSEGTTGGRDSGTTDTVTSTSTPAPTETPTATETPTPERQPPKVNEVSLITEWEKFGDVLDKQIEGAAPGTNIVVGYRYNIQIHDGVHDITKQARIYDSSDTRITQASSEDRQLVDSSGYQEWEGTFYFDTTDWEIGNYEAEVIVRDNVTGDVSKSKSGEFSLNSPLTGNDASLVSYDGPDTLQSGEEYSYSLDLQNNSNRDSSIISPLSVKRGDSDWYTYPDSMFRLTIPSNEQRTWESETATAPSDKGVYTYRIDDIGETWTYEIV